MKTFLKLKVRSRNLAATRNELFFNNKIDLYLMSAINPPIRGSLPGAGKPTF